MDFDLNIRINQVASMAIQVEERPESHNSENRPQRFLSLGKELWIEVKQNMVEYNFDHMLHCS